MTRAIGLVGLALLALVPPAPLLAQAPKQPPRKPAAKAAPRPAPKPAAAAPKPEPPAPDLEVTARYVAGDKTTLGTLLLHATRQRVAYDAGLIAIQQCDAHQSLQLNPLTRVYLAMPDASPEDAAAPPAAPGKPKGGRVTYTTAVADTGETKEMFGFTARRLKTTVAKDSSPEACDRRPERVEIDGWYVDLPDTVSCTGAPPPEREIRLDPKDAACRDTVTYDRPGASRAYPVAYTMVTTAGTDAPLTTTMDATSVKRTTIDPQQFEAPPDYVRVTSPVQLTADHRPGEDGVKKPGSVRVGVAPVGNASGQPVSTGDLGQALIESLEEAGTDAVLLKGTTPAQLADEARARSCDFILGNTISEMKRPGRGMLGKIAGTSADALSAKVDYTLTTPGAAKPALSASERSGTSMLQTAVGAARRVSQFVTPMMMARYGYMHAFAAMSGSATPGMMAQTPDPMLSTVFRLVDRATGTKPQPILTTEDGAAAAALQKEIESLLAELKKRKT